MNEQIQQLKEQIKHLKDQKQQLMNPEKAKKEPANENLTSYAKNLLAQYTRSRRNSNLNEAMDTHKKEARRLNLMETAVSRLFRMMEDGMTDEEIVLSHAQEGVSVPENFVSKIRKYQENLKKAKMELEMAENEYKNISKEIVNNVPGQDSLTNTKKLSTHLLNTESRKR